MVKLSSLSVVPSIGNVATELINATRNTLSGTKNLGAAVKGFSKNGVNRLNNLIKTGKSPKSVQRADKGRIFGEKDHVHFSDGSALNADGTWKHGGRSLSNSKTKFLKENGWTLPL